MAEGKKKLTPVRNVASNLKSKKILVFSAVAGMVLGVPASPDVQCWALGICGGCYLLGQGIADGRR